MTQVADDQFDLPIRATRRDASIGTDGKIEEWLRTNFFVRTDFFVP